MRPIVAFAAVLLLAGCTGEGAGEGPGEEAELPSSPEEGSSTGATPDPATPPTPSPSSPAQPAPPPPPSGFEPIHIEHDFTGDEKSVAFGLPARAGKGEITLHLLPLGPGSDVGAPCAGSNARAEVRTPEGTVVIEASVGAVTVNSNDECGGGSYRDILAAGEWRADFSGRGSLRAVLDVIPEN